MSRLQKGRISCCKIIEAHILRTQCTILEIFLLEDRAAHARPTLCLEYGICRHRRPVGVAQLCSYRCSSIRTAEL